jgi:DNA topoisomerase-3
MNANRLYTVKHGGINKYYPLTVQTPTRMVVDRFKEIENFKPQPYWELQTLYRDTLLAMRKDAF